MIFSDFECGYCAKAAPVLRQLAAAYPKEVQILFKNFPLPFHSRAPMAHEAAMEAADQGKFWEMHDLLFGDQTKLDRTSLVRYARQIGLDIERFERALDGLSHRSVIERDVQEAQAYGVTGTPTFFVILRERHEARRSAATRDS